VRGIDGEQIRSRSISEEMSEEDEGGRKKGECCMRGLKGAEVGRVNRIQRIVKPPIDN
jgi:hypothetical protein